MDASLVMDACHRYHCPSSPSLSAIAIIDCHRGSTGQADHRLQLGRNLVCNGEAIIVSRWVEPIIE